MQFRSRAAGLGRGGHNGCMVKPRVRVQVGSGGVLYLVVSGLILGAAVYTQANLLFWGFGLMVGGLVLSVAWSVAALRGLEVTRTVPKHAAVGELMVVRYELHNRNWLAVFGLTVREGWGRGRRGWRRSGPVARRPRQLSGPPHAWASHVSPGRSIGAEAPCWPLARGRLRFERVEAVTGFPFGIVQKAVVFHQADEVLVFPAIYRLGRSLLDRLASSTGSGAHAVDRPGGHEEFFGLREYRPGDPQRVIDWKRTARTGTLVAREMTSPRPPVVSLLLDLREAPPDGAGGGAGGSVGGWVLEERAISLAASVICEGYQSGYRVGLAVLGPSCPVFPALHSVVHRTTMLQALARLDLSRRGGGAAVDRSRCNVIIWAGPGTATQSPRRAGPGGGAGVTVLGAADFERYVVDPSRALPLAEAAAKAPVRVAGVPRGRAVRAASGGVGR